MAHIFVYIIYKLIHTGCPLKVWPIFHEPIGETIYLGGMKSLKPNIEIMFFDQKVTFILKEKKKNKSYLSRLKTFHNPPFYKHIHS